jgi:predicted site-specific integrase-resolvase
MSTTLTLPEAARMAGCSTTTLRRWLSNGIVEGGKNQSGDWRVAEQSLRVYLSTATPSTKATRCVQGASGSETQITMEATELVIELRESLSRERKVNDDLRSQIRNFEQERTQHLAEMRALLSGKSEGLLSLKKWFGK